MSRLARLAPLALLTLAACGGDARPRSGSTGGTLIIAAASEPDILLPPLVATTQGKQTVDLIFDGLADIGDSLNTVGDVGFRPRLARRWTWSRDSLSVAFELDPRARWHDGVPVTARDVAFTHRVIVDPATGSPLAEFFADVDSVSVRDSLTAVVWWKRRSPEQFFNVVYNTAVLPEHLLGAVPRAGLRATSFARQPVGSGPFRFARWVSGQRVEVVADTAHWRGRPALDRVVWAAAADPVAAAANLRTGAADFVEMLRGPGADQVAKTPTVRTIRYGSLDYGYVLFNFRAPTGAGSAHPLFADRALRRALSAAVDREVVVRNVLDTLGLVALGPVTRVQPTADSGLRAIAHAPAEAARQLDALGWTRDAPTGMRARGGRPLEFTLLVPASSSTRVRAAVLVQAQLAAVGARVRIEELDPTTFAARLRDGKFDAAFNVWRTDPSPSSVRQVLGTRRPGSGGANYGGYASAAFDALVDSAATAYDPVRSRGLYARAYQLALDDAPAVWIYEPRNVAAAHRRLEIPALRADAWWASIPEWRIPADVQIPRDRIGPVTVAATTP